MTNLELTAATVLERAIESARARLDDIIRGLQVLNALDGIDTPQGDALFWIAQKLRADVYEVLLDLDHAEQARRGETFSNATQRFAVLEDVSQLQATMRRATAGAAGRPQVDEADRGGVS